MSLVGTRPPTVDEWDKYELHHRARLATKPGLTGMWQVSGRSNIGAALIKGSYRVIKKKSKSVDESTEEFKTLNKELELAVHCSQRALCVILSIT